MGIHKQPCKPLCECAAIFINSTVYILKVKSDDGIIILQIVRQRLYRCGLSILTSAVNAEVFALIDQCFDFLQPFANIDHIVIRRITSSCCVKLLHGWITILSQGLIEILPSKRHIL